MATLWLSCCQNRATRTPPDSANMTVTNNMTVKKLKQIIADLADETPVLVPASDHSYRSEIDVVATTALRNGNAWTEDFIEGAEYGKRLAVLVIT